MNPSTATLARICRLLIRIKVCGIDQRRRRPRRVALRRSGSLGRLGAGRVRTSVLGSLHVFEQAVDHRVDGHAVGLGAVAEQDPVPQRGMDQGADVFGRGVEPAPRARPGPWPPAPATGRRAGPRPSSPNR